MMIQRLAHGTIFWALALGNLAAFSQDPDPSESLRIGVIGLDTSHAIAFTEAFNSPNPSTELKGFRVVSAYPQGSRDIESSVTRVPEYTKKMQALGVEIVDSIPKLVAQVDCVLLETNDGRPHLEQVLPVLAAHKPVFVDKPVAGSLADAVAIYLAASKYQTPVFSSSSLRYVTAAQKARDGGVGKVTGCDAYSPCSLEATHPDLYWYGIHGVELLFTVMGPGCQSVQRASTPQTDFAVGVWEGERVGTFRGIRPPGTRGYGGKAFGSEGILDLGDFEGYGPLIVEIAKFFRTGTPPVTATETIEIYAFMSAADASKSAGGQPVRLGPLIETARQDAVTKLRELGVDL